MVIQKIVIAANTDYRFDQRLQRISSCLEDAGYQVELLGRQFGQTPHRYGSAIHLPLWFKKGKLSYLEFNLRLFFFLFFKHADAICSVDLDTLPACWLITKLRGNLLIQDSHEYMAEVPEVAFRPFTKRMWHYLAGKLLPACHLRYTVSQSLVEEFGRVYNQSFELIRNMAIHLPPSERKANLPGLPERDYLVFLGAVNRGRGLEEILEVLIERDEKLIIAGDGDILSEIRELTERYGLKDRVFFTGKILPEQARWILQNARAGINLLRSEGLSYQFSLANKFFDYLQAGIPQLCIDFPEYRNLMKEFEVGILTALDRESISRGLDQLQNPAVRERLSSQAEIARQVWNWQQECQRLLSLYSDLFDRRRNGKPVSQ